MNIPKQHMIPINDPIVTKLKDAVDQYYKAPALLNLLSRTDLDESTFGLVVGFRKAITKLCAKTDTDMSMLIGDGLYKKVFNSNPRSPKKT